MNAFSKIKSGNYTCTYNEKFVLFEEIDGFIRYINRNKPEDRVFYMKDCIPLFIDGVDELLAEEKMPMNKKLLLRQRKALLVDLLST